MKNIFSLSTVETFATLVRPSGILGNPTAALDSRARLNMRPPTGFVKV
jgi:hypothetical protein